MSMKNIYFIIAALLLVHYSLAEDLTKSQQVGTGSFIVSAINTDEANHSETNTAKPKTIFRPAYTRAELKVSRSLNPDSMQTLSVRTNNGGIAQILVKKRDGKTSLNNEPRTSAFYDASNQFSRGEVRRGLFGPTKVVEQLNDEQIQKLHQQQQNFEHGRIYQGWSQLQPVTTLQQSQAYASSPYRFSPPSDQKSANLINSFMKHVQQVENSRQGRSSSSILRNDRSQIYTKVPEPVVINSENVNVVAKDQQNAKRGRSLMEIGSDGIPIISGIRVPDDENDKKQTWRQGRVINGELVPYENGYVPPRTVEYGQLIYPSKKEEVQGREKGVGPFTTADNFSDEQESKGKGIGPFSVRDVRDMFSSRSNAKAGIGPFSVADNSRTSNAKLIDYIKRINDEETRKDYFVSRTPKDTGSQQKIQRRMLINPGTAYFPPSSRYTTEKVKGDEAITAYAHPEFGLQSVSSYEEAKNNQQKDLNKNYRQNNPVYQIEPALNTREYYSQQQQPRNPQQMVSGGAPSMYHPQYSNYAYVRRVRPEQPFWVKISEQVRDTFQSGFAQMAHVAKPVMDPILEAGEKISHNLGFSPPPVQHAQEKVGVSMIPGGPNSNYIFPALGMLAGGAALGLGAVAMGRIFDVGSLLTMRSSDDPMDLEHKRAIEAIRKMPTTTLFLVDENKHQQLDAEDESILNKPATYATSDSKAKFIELIAIPSSADLNIDPSTVLASSSPNHQRRKRN